LPVPALATNSAEAARAAAVRAGATGRIITDGIDPERVAAAVGSGRPFRVGGAAADGFAPLSGFFRAKDGFVRTHANYPHHRARLLRILGLADADRETLAKAPAASAMADVPRTADAVRCCLREMMPEQTQPASCGMFAFG
jgi:hypothetical protein